MAKPCRAKGSNLIDMYNAVFAHVVILHTDGDIFHSALQTAKATQLNGMDAVHVCIGKHHDCKLFVSSDKHFKGINIVNPLFIEL